MATSTQKKSWVFEDQAKQVLLRLKLLLNTRTFTLGGNVIHLVPVTIAMEITTHIIEGKGGD